MSSLSKEQIESLRETIIEDAKDYSLGDIVEILDGGSYNQSDAYFENLERCSLEALDLIGTAEITVKFKGEK